jgi:hypothetical protein
MLAAITFQKLGRRKSLDQKNAEEGLGIALLDRGRFTRRACGLRNYYRAFKFLRRSR